VVIRPITSFGCKKVNFVAGTQTHVYVRPQARNKGGLHGRYRYSVQPTTKNRTRGCTAVAVGTGRCTRPRTHSKKGAKSDQCESRHWDATAREDATVNNSCIAEAGVSVARLACGREKAASVYTFRNLKRRNRLCNSERCRYSWDWGFYKRSNNISLIRDIGELQESNFVLQWREKYIV